MAQARSGVSVARRRLLQAMLAGIASLPCALRAQAPRIPIADMHSHYGMITRRMADAGLAGDMRNRRVAHGNHARVLKSVLRV